MRCAASRARCSREDPDAWCARAHFLSATAGPRRGGVGILSSSGGGAGIASDRVERAAAASGHADGRDDARAARRAALPPQADNPIDLGGRKKPEEVEIAGDVARHPLRGSRRRLRARDPHLDAVLRQPHAADRRGRAGRRQAGDDRAHAGRGRRRRPAAPCARSGSSTSTAPRTRCASWRCVAEHDARRAAPPAPPPRPPPACPMLRGTRAPGRRADRERGQAAAGGLRRPRGGRDAPRRRRRPPAAAAARSAFPSR